MKAIAFAVVMSILVHLGFWWAGDELVSRSGSRPVADEPMIKVSYVTEEPESSDDERQLIKLDRVERERVPTKDTPYVSEFNNTTERETRAPRQRPKRGPTARPQQAQPRRQATSGEQAKPQDSAPTAAAERGEDASSHPVEPLALRPDGLEARSTRSRNTDPIVRPHASSDLREALQQQWGQTGTMDAIREDIEEGDANVLNSRRFKFASFFNRVRDQIAQEWRPAEVHAARDPDGSKYGLRRRHTRLFISLNADGSLRRIRLEHSSGVDFLDEEAIRAVRAAAPFSNPPQGLVDPHIDGIEFSFGFILDVGGRSRIFRYRQ